MCSNCDNYFKNSDRLYFNNLYSSYKRARSFSEAFDIFSEKISCIFASAFQDQFRYQPDTPLLQSSIKVLLTRRIPSFRRHICKNLGMRGLRYSKIKIPVKLLHTGIIMGMDHPGIRRISNSIIMPDQCSCIDHVFIKTALSAKPPNSSKTSLEYAAQTFEQKKVLIPQTGRSSFLLTEDSSG